MKVVTSAINVLDSPKKTIGSRRGGSSKYRAGKRKENGFVINSYRTVMADNKSQYLDTGK